LAKRGGKFSVAIVEKFSIGFMSNPNPEFNQIHSMSFSPPDAFQLKSTKVEGAVHILTMREILSLRLGYSTRNVNTKDDITPTFSLITSYSPDS